MGHGNNSNSHKLKILQKWNAHAKAAFSLFVWIPPKCTDVVTGDVKNLIVQGIKTIVECIIFTSDSCRVTILIVALYFIIPTAENSN